MTRTAKWLLMFGILLFVGILASQGPLVMATFSRAVWGLPLAALFHLLPLGLDAAAICVLFPSGFSRSAFKDSVLTRWAGEAANSLLPAGQLGGPVLMARHLARRSLSTQDASAAITVSTTLQTFGQILFALVGVLFLGAQAGHVSPQTLRTSALLASGLLALQVGGFYLLQRRGFFSKLMAAVTRLSAKRDWSSWVSQAQAMDTAVQATYARGGSVAASFFLSLLGWFVGTGEVFLIVHLLGTAVSWRDALLLESLGQAVRGAGFAVPGALGVQEGGYLLLAPMAGLSPDTGLALSLAKRARELLLGLPALLYLHWSARGHAEAAAR